MPKKYIKDTQISLKDKPKAETVIVKGTITRDQRELIQKLAKIR